MVPVPALVLMLMIAVSLVPPHTDVTQLPFIDPVFVFALLFEHEDA
jgi:hypothetical protein